MNNHTNTDEVYSEVAKRIHVLLAADDAAVRGNLANLRRGIGRIPGEDPYVWGVLFNALPEKMLGKYGNPSKEEWAIYTAMTLYALHQQGKDHKMDCVNIKGVSLGKAAAMLVAKDGGDESARERVNARFNQVVLSSDIESMSYYLRNFIQRLRTESIPLDYPMLAKDLYLYQIPGAEAGVKLRWGQDYYYKGE